MDRRHTYTDDYMTAAPTAKHIGSYRLGSRLGHSHRRGTRWKRERKPFRWPHLPAEGEEEESMDLNELNCTTNITGYL